MGQPVMRIQIRLRFCPDSSFQIGRPAIRDPQFLTAETTQIADARLSKRPTSAVTTRLQLSICIQYHLPYQQTVFLAMLDREDATNEEV